MPHSSADRLRSAFPRGSGGVVAFDAELGVEDEVAPPRVSGRALGSGSEWLDGRHGLQYLVLDGGPRVAGAPPS